MERVADPAPSLALTTSSPPNCTPEVVLVDISCKRSSSLTVGQSIKLVLGNLDSRLGLAEKRYNGLSRVTTNDGNDGLGWVLLAGDALHEGLGTDNIKGGDTEQLLWVELASSLEDLGGNWDSAVDRVGDDENVGVRASLCDTLDEIADDTGVDLE